MIYKETRIKLFKEKSQKLKRMQSYANYSAEIDFKIEPDMCIKLSGDKSRPDPEYGFTEGLIIKQKQPTSQRTIHRNIKGPTLEDLQSILSRLEVSNGLSHTKTQAYTNIDDAFTPDKDGDNLLMSAIIYNREDVANAILDIVPNYDYVNFQNKEGQSALHLAVILNMVTLARRLVAWGSDVGNLDNHGNTALHIACRDGNMPAIQVLTTPLGHSEIEGRSYYVPYRRLPQNMEIRNYDGNTCLHMAVLCKQYHVMDYLIKRMYADINAPDPKSGETLLHYAIKTNDAVLLSYLLEIRSTDLNHPRYDGLRPIDMTEMLGNVTFRNALVRKGAESSHIYKNKPKNMDTNYDDIIINGTLLI